MCKSYEASGVTMLKTRTPFFAIKNYLSVRQRSHPLQLFMSAIAWLATLVIAAPPPLGM